MSHRHPPGARSLDRQNRAIVITEAPARVIAAIRITSVRWRSDLPPNTDNVGDQYDWTTGGPHDANDWKKYRVVPRAHPWRTLPCAYFNRFGSKEAFSFPGGDLGSLPLYGGTFARSHSVSTLVLVDPVFVALQFESCDWRSLQSWLARVVRVR